MKFRRISALFEWLLVVTFNLYTLTFTYEFRHIQLATILRHWTGESWEFMELPTEEGGASAAEGGTAAPDVVAVGSDAVKLPPEAETGEENGNQQARYPCLHLDGSVHTATACEVCSVEGKAHPV